MAVATSMDLNLMASIGRLSLSSTSSSSSRTVFGASNLFLPSKSPLSNSPLRLTAVPARKKGSGSTKNGRDSRGQKFAQPGASVVRQRGAKSSRRENSKEDENMDEDAFEALFKQLEEDLKNDEEFLGDGDDEISEEDLAMLEQELEEALAEDEDLSQLLNLTSNGATSGEDEEMENELVKVEDAGKENYDDDDDDDDDDSEEEDEPVKLRSWQLRRLAYALKVGRRKTNIKNLSAELCLDRAVVLQLLRDPPPNLLMMSAALPDKPEPTMAVPSSDEAMALVPSEVINEPTEPESKVETPIHVLQGSWSAQKRLKKVHINTLESVYRRTKWPTNAMISSIVQVTNLPRRRVVKWFEDKRSADGVPEQRLPLKYNRSSSESVHVQ